MENTFGGKIMGAMFQFVATNMKTGKPVQTEVFVGGTSKGFTKENHNQPLQVSMSSTGTFEWYAKKFGKTVARGKSSGGNINIPIDPGEY